MGKKYHISEVSLLINLTFYLFIFSTWRFSMLLV